MDLGSPISYEVLRAGTPAFSSDGQEVGRVAHVLADSEADIFDGLVLDFSRGPGGHRFADATQVAAIHERGVTLSVDAAAAERLPEPSENPAVVDVDPDDVTGGELSVKLRRAWDWISGNY